MVSVSNIDSFIEKTSALLLARPSTTKISTRYSYKTFKKLSNTTTPLPALVFVKAYDPISGTCFSIKLTKINELSRVWSALGPRGVEMSKQTKEGSVVSVRQRGLASMMSGVNIEHEQAAHTVNPETKVPSVQVADTASIVIDKENVHIKNDASKSKKKKKGKK
ncbi:hypothetical protein NADFUDRAFT_82058 [Nadsonia fulvescens var. elongata DSM 6958]|uniref:SRP9 domain-containing protein n=1 Tax=Nadsonia fulvescens var. elongata DSM 6958 TaxID=857566 RepID=A0A1E3PQC9_9ASCO|nr:hypothetical protein NADFUDRAFT_82058 [Nadsonia fulvescens var. elongata DSM 6958]